METSFDLEMHGTKGFLERTWCHPADLNEFYHDLFGYLECKFLSFEIKQLFIFLRSGFYQGGDSNINKPLLTKKAVRSRHLKNREKPF